MNLIDDLQALNLSTLKDLQARIEGLAKEIGQAITRNERAVALARARNDALEEMYGPIDNIPVSRDVELILSLAGPKGLTSTQIYHEIAETRRVTLKNVRATLQRLHAVRKARYVQRRWYSNG